MPIFVKLADDGHLGIATNSGYVGDLDMGDDRERSDNAHVDARGAASENLFSDCMRGAKRWLIQELN